MHEVEYVPENITPQNTSDAVCETRVKIISIFVGELRALEQRRLEIVSSKQWHCKIIFNWNYSCNENKISQTSDYSDSKLYEANIKSYRVLQAMSTPDVSQVHNAFLTVKSWSPFERRIPEHALQPLYTRISRAIALTVTRDQGRKETRKKKKELQLLPVTRRGAFGRCHASSAQNRPPVREGESTGQKEKQDGKKRRERTRSAASTSLSQQHQCGEIFGELQNSNSSASSVAVLLARCCFLGVPATTRIYTTRYATTSCSFPLRRQSFLLL